MSGWNAIPEYAPFQAWDSGNYPVVLKSYELKTTKPEKGSKLMFQASFECAENDHPAIQAYAGRTINDWFVVGSEKDPGVEDSDTLNNGKSMGVQKIKALAKAAGVEPDDADDDITMDMLNDVLDQVIGTELTMIVKARGTGTNKTHNVNGYVAMGEVQIGLTTDGGSSGGKEKKKNFNPQQHNEGPKSVASAVKAAMDAKAKKAKKVEPIIEDDDELEETPAKKPKKVGKASVKCPMCSVSFPYDQLSKHVDECVGASTELEDDDE